MVLDDNRRLGGYCEVMSATEIINELPKLTVAERRAVLNKLRELAQSNKDIQASHAAADRIEEEATAYGTVQLDPRDISEAHAADLRARLKTFAEDWKRPEAAIYDHRQYRNSVRDRD